MIIPDFVSYLEQFKSENPNVVKISHFNVKEIEHTEYCRDKLGGDILTVDDFSLFNSTETEVIFALKSNVIFTNKGFVIHEKQTGVKNSIKGLTTLYTYDHLFNMKVSKMNMFKNTWSQITYNGKIIAEMNIPYKNYEVSTFEIIKENYITIRDNYKKRKLEDEKKSEERRLTALKTSQSKIVMELDKDGNGIVDVIEGDDFKLLLRKHQEKIVEIDKNYVHRFVKLSQFLKTKKNNIQSIFDSIKDTPNKEVLDVYAEILKQNIHSYNLILFHSLNMIVSLVEDDMITFYEIYEMFDSLNIFDSQHEKDISQKLTNIGDGIKDLMYTMEQVGYDICYSLDQLTYATEETNNLLDEKLKNIQSGIQTNNLLSTISTYQLYKINKQTKGLID